MKQVLKEVNIGERFQKAIGNIYSDQTAALVVNKEITEKIKVQKGTRQGCPLSPFLFVLTLEVLLNEIQKDEQIRGIKIRNHQFKYRTFADDVAFFLEDPKVNIPKLLNKIENYDQYAGFKVNKTSQNFSLKI